MFRPLKTHKVIIIILTPRIVHCSWCLTLDIIQGKKGHITSWWRFWSSVYLMYLSFSKCIILHDFQVFLWSHNFCRKHIGGYGRTNIIKLVVNTDLHFLVLQHAYNTKQHICYKLDRSGMEHKGLPTDGGTGAHSPWKSRCPGRKQIEQAVGDHHRIIDGHDCIDHHCGNSNTWKKKKVNTQKSSYKMCI